MTIRVSETEVKAIMEDYVDESRLTPFIKQANHLVESRLTNLTGTNYTEEELVNIELWLSAHFASATIYRMPYRREGLDTAVAYKMNTPQSGLGSTIYGETALDLEYLGILKDLNKNRIVFNKL